MNQLTVSIVTPTLNIMRVIDEYLEGIIIQTYPHDKIEVLIADGGSTDGTIEKLKEYNDKTDFDIRIYDNPLRTGEAGKAVAVRKAKSDVVLLLDSDNILPDPDWLDRMMKPFDEADIVASEPIYFTYRKQDSLVNRYCAVLGMGDPLCLFMGNYDRYSCVSGKWTTIPHEEIDKGDYLSIRFYDAIPTIGANGFIMRTRALNDNFDGEYLFDIDVLWKLFQKDSSLRVAKVKTGIVHLYCPDMKTFFRKQKRRINDFLFFSDSKGREYPWTSFGKGRIVLFIICCITIVPLLIQALIGFIRKHDVKVWLFHFVACWITLIVYGLGTIKSLFGHTEASDRSTWKQ